MVSCVVCAEGECSSDCIFVDVFPADIEESKINAEKVLSGWPVKYVKDLLMQAKVNGGVDMMKVLVNNWIGKYQITSYYKRNKAAEEENAAKREKKRMLEKQVADLTKKKEAAEKRLASKKRKIEKNNDLIARQVTYLEIQSFVLDELKKNPSPPGSDNSDRIQRLVKDQLAKHAAAAAASAPASVSSYADRIKRLKDQLAKSAAASAPPCSASFSSAPAIPVNNDADLN